MEASPENVPSGFAAGATEPDGVLLTHALIAHGSPADSARPVSSTKDGLKNSSRNCSSC
ncbi:hypothetical protein HNR26_000804 [Rhizobium rosettiformans]|uniref:Uncharacterized protein n=1 Tax=Rhizobium rosettiformans TaxID=1368430 RepID=A0A7W8MB28_9HYPH|nr:hypothetical protein [Rhizobium rosettiformans]